MTRVWGKKWNYVGLSRGEHADPVGHKGVEGKKGGPEGALIVEPWGGKEEIVQDVLKDGEKEVRSCETCARKGTESFCLMCPDYRHWRSIVKKAKKEKWYPVAGPKTRAAARTDRSAISSIVR